MGKGEEFQYQAQPLSNPVTGYSTVDFGSNATVLPPHLSNAPPPSYQQEDYEKNLNGSYREERKPLLSDEVALTVREVGEEVVEKVGFFSRLFCGVLEISCHWWTLFILFLLYISLASLGLVGFFQHMRVSWEDRQQSCISQLPPVLDQCYLDRIYRTPGKNNEFWWFAHPANTFTNETARLYPDCRFIVKPGYSGIMSELYGSDLKTGSLVPCYLPSDWKERKAKNPNEPVNGILSPIVWPSHTGKTGFGASLGVGLGVMFLFGVCAWVSWLISAECRDNCVVDLHAAGDVEPDWTALWGYPNTVFWTCNPFYCVKLCIPITVPLKIIMNVMIVVITVTLLIIYVFLSGNSSNTRY